MERKQGETYAAYRERRTKERNILDNRLRYGVRYYDSKALGTIHKVREGVYVGTKKD